MFRGQTKASRKWKLVPLIARQYRLPRQQGYENWYGLEADLMGDFRRLSTPFLGQHKPGWLELLMIGQHYRLPTRLLDWTTNPLKALFFAVEDQKDSTSGAVWVLPITSFYPLPDSPESIDTVVPILNPPQLDNRIVAQESCFTLFPYPRGNAPIRPLELSHDLTKLVSDPLVKVHIPGDRKLRIRLELIELGITHRSLFPGLESIAASLAARDRDHRVRRILRTVAQADTPHK